MSIGINLKDELKESKEQNDKEMNLVISETKALLANNEASKVEALKALGLDDEIKDYEAKQSIALDEKQLKKKFGKNLFHRDDIKTLCVKYDLLFVKTKFYKGTITKDFPEQVVNFAEKYQIDYGREQDSWDGDRGKFLILSPREHFRKNKKKRGKVQSKNAMLFYNVGENHYKLVYTWGNSFNIFRLLKAWRKRGAFNYYIHTSIILFAILMIGMGFVGLHMIWTFSISLLVSFLLSLAFLKWDDDGIDRKHEIYSCNSWNSDNGLVY